MQLKLSMLISDYLIFFLVFLICLAVFFIRKHKHLREAWKQVFSKSLSTIAFIIFMSYLVIALLDSVHFKVSQKDNLDNINSMKRKSLLDFIFMPLGDLDEKTYSAPFANQLFVKSIIKQDDGSEKRTYARLKYAGLGSLSKTKDIFFRILKGFFWGLLLSFSIIEAFLLMISLGNFQSFKQKNTIILKNKSQIKWTTACLTFVLICIFWSCIYQVSRNYHILGTSQIGQDILNEAIKSIRTGLLIGTLTTLFMLPFSLVLGTLAGYFTGIIDDIIGYLYTTISSIPSVLLISASILVLQIYLSTHSDLFSSLEQRSDARLLTLCLILGLTSWAHLCRLLRGETLKLKEMAYIRAAISLGVKPLTIIWNHILTNVMHIVLITIVLDFSGLVLAEAVLSYVGIGVDPTTMSWGNMINNSRLELARHPIVWWPLLAALLFMFVLILSANIFADAVRDAFDPKLKDKI